MADISKITLPNGDEYNLKDTLARESIPTKVSELENDARYMSGMTILAYGKSTWDDFIEAYGDSKVIYCRASSGSNPASGSQTRLAFMAYVNNAENPTEVEFQYYRSVNVHTDAQQGDQVYVYKLNKSSGWTVTVRNAFSKLVTGTGLTHTYSNGTITIESSGVAADVVSTTADGLAPQLPDESTTTKFLRQDATWAVPEYPVTSVNGSTGAVTVDVPSKTSDLQNDSGFITGITSADVTTALGYTPPTQDTTYESKTAASGGTDVSLVTTGEKYTWNNKGNGTITGITMNGASKGTSGVVDLGTVITAHQDISGKADKSATVSNVAYDSTNKKITKTVNGTTSDVVSVATIKTDLALAKGDVGLGNVDNVKQYSASNPPPYPVTSVNGSTGAVTVSVPSAGTATPNMDGTAAVGSSAKYAKEDHVHPTDTSRQATITASGILKGNGNGGVSAAVAGTDYLTPATNYSPVFRLSPGASHAITSADSGMTFVDSYSSTASTLDILLTLSQADSSAFPVGAEIALTRIYSKSTKLTVSGVRLFNADAGIIGSASGTATIQISPQRGMAAIKKIESNNATYGDVWLLTGNVEVVS